MKKTFIALVVYALLVIFALVGEIKCISKAIKANWDPIGKTEIVYTAAAFTGLGSIVGWINISLVDLGYRQLQPPNL